MSERVLITGGAGFIGSNAARILMDRGYDVVVLDDLTLGNKENVPAGAQFVEGNACDKAVYEKIGAVDYIIHLAGASSSPMFVADLAAAMTTNVVSHVAVLEHAHKCGAKKVIYASTSSIYGNNPVPLTEDQSVTAPNYYAVSKHCMEELSHVFNDQTGLEIIGFRFMSVYGLHEEHKGQFANLVSQFIWGLEEGKSPVIYGDGNQTRDFTNVKDVVNAFYLAMTSDKTFGSDVFNVGTSHAINMHDLMDILNAEMGTNIQPTLIENPIKKGYVKTQMADLGKISAQLGYAPQISLEEGVREIIENRKNNPIKPVSLSY